MEGSLYLPIYKRKKFLRGLVDVSIKVKTGKEGDPVYALQASNFNREDFKEERIVNKWTRININKQVYLIQGVSKYQTAFTEVGELVTKLCFVDRRIRDGVRIKYGDFNNKDLLKIGRIMHESYAPASIKKRVLNRKKNHND